jgi:hypothetical protein
MSSDFFVTYVPDRSDQENVNEVCVRVISPEAEYKALRDEMMHLLNRIFTLLAAMVAGSVLVFTRALELQSTSPRIASYLLLILCVTLAVAIILTCKMHEHIDKIRYYILVYHEPDNNSRDHSGSWHRLVAEFNRDLDLGKLQDLPRTHKWFFSYGDLTTIFALYVVLVLVAVFMVSSFPPILFESYFCRHIGRWQASAFGALFLLFVALLVSLLTGYYDGLESMERWWRAFKNSPAAGGTQPPGGRHRG